MFRSGNPALKVFDNPQTIAGFDRTQSRAMTVQGTVNAAFILVSLCAAGAIGSWWYLSSGAASGLVAPVLLGGLIGGGLLGLIISFSPRTAPYLSPIYAICEGALMGALSLAVATRFKTPTGAGTGIIFQAVFLTFGIFAALLLAYTMRLVRVGTTMQRWVCAALGGVCLFYVAGVLLRFCGIQMPLFHEMFGWGKAGMIGIGFSSFMLVLGSLFLVMDFQAIEAGAKAGAPKYMEWYGAFSLLVTLVWLYVEALRLLSKLRDR
jgi:uncharacterized YccA/Bax inhibitor family protein